MATKKCKLRFRIQHRLEVWISTVIEADSFEDALSIAKNMSLGDYYDEREGTELIDSNTLRGMSVGEEF